MKISWVNVECFASMMRSSCVFSLAFVSLKSLHTFQRLSCSPCMFSLALVSVKSVHAFHAIFLSRYGLCLPLSSVPSLLHTKGSFTFGFLRLTIITAVCPPFTCKGMATITNHPLSMHYCTTLWTCLFFKKIFL